MTRAFFAQGDLSDKHILEDFWGTLEEGLGAWRRSPLLAGGSDSGAPEDAGEREREKEREKEREAEWEGNMYMGQCGCREAPQHATADVAQARVCGSSSTSGASRRSCCSSCCSCSAR